MRRSSSDINTLYARVQQISVLRFRCKLVNFKLHYYQKVSDSHQFKSYNTVSHKIYIKLTQYRM